MAALAERVREALHVGDFSPTSLEAEERMLRDCDPYAEQLSRYSRAAARFATDTRDFAAACGRLLTDAPTPRMWRQPLAPSPAVAAASAVAATSAPAPAAAEVEAVHVAVPEEHAALFTAELHERLAEVTEADCSGRHSSRQPSAAHTSF